jgi:hypothetical protein
MSFMEFALHWNKINVKDKLYVNWFVS